MARRIRVRGRNVGAWLAAALALAGCKPSRETAKSPPAPAPIPRESAPELASRLAGAWIDAAKEKLTQLRPDEALALLVSALRADPASEEARNLAASILTETSWNFPVLTLNHQLPVQQIALSGTDLWVSLGGTANTTVRWDLDSLEIGNLLFPTDQSETRSLTFDIKRRWAVIERGGVTLLCDAHTLKPIRDLGKLPNFLTPAAVVVFSTDGLLLAHPTADATDPARVVWNLRDAATGEIIRSSEPVAGEPAPVAAQLDRRRLRVLRTDGSLFEMPVSPIEEMRITPPAAPMHLLQAQFSVDGNSALTLQEPAPHEPPVRRVIALGTGTPDAFDSNALMSKFSWSRQPNVWSGLMSGPEPAPFSVDVNRLKMTAGGQAPISTASSISATAFDATHAITAEENGLVTFHRWLPLPIASDNTAPGELRGAAQLAALEALAAAATGLRYDEKERAFTPVSADKRVEMMAACDLAKLQGVFPKLDFQALADALKSLPRRSAAPEAFQPLWDRLARADLGGKSWPQILKLAKDLEGTPWHQQLTAAVLGQAGLAPTAKLEEIFQTGDDATVLAAIQEAGKTGPSAATALALALKSESPAWIAACLDQAENLPPVLFQLGRSRIAWLEERKADALSGWPEDFPNLADIRAREDWDGWEQADFEPALANIRQCVTDEMATITLPENSTPEQRQAVAEKLKNPQTLATVGKRRFAAACLSAALAFSTHKEDAETTFSLAKSARDLGAPPEPCLRAEALALTALGDYKNAHPRWIELLTEHPVETTIPGDYAEAAYTAFENFDPRQAMEILTTGMHRFPNDADFALRAGWVSLLTGKPDRAYRFLQGGSRIGYPADKLENATALLAISAQQSGAREDAAVYFQDLVKIDQAWADPATLDTLDWPPDLKTVLSQLMQPDFPQTDLPQLGPGMPEIMLPDDITPGLLPELVPTDP